MKAHHMKGLVFDIKRYAVHDGPGIRSTVFLKGCPLRCLWCHSPESQNNYPEIMYFEAFCIRCGSCENICPNNAQTTNIEHKIQRERCKRCGKCVESCYSEALRIVGKYMTVKDVIQELLKDKRFYKNSHGGITVSGGEPTMQPEFTKNLLRECNEYGLHTVLDTCGYVSWPILQEILKSVDLVLYDIKHLDNGKHNALTGVPNDLILENLKKLDATSQNYIIRVPLIPSLNDSVKHIATMANDFLEFENAEYIEILPYHQFGVSKYKHLDKPYPLKHLNLPTSQYLEQLHEKLSSQGLKIIISSLKPLK